LFNDRNVDFNKKVH